MVCCYLAMLKVRALLRQRDCQGRSQARHRLRRGCGRSRRCFPAFFTCRNALGAPQVGFEFKQRRALPILDGVVVAIESGEALLEVSRLATMRFWQAHRFPFKAYWETAQAAEEKERQKQQERVVKRWQKLIHGLRVRERLMKEYSVGVPSGTTAEVDGDVSLALL